MTPAQIAAALDRVTAVLQRRPETGLHASNRSDTRRLPGLPDATGVAPERLRALG